MNIVTGQTKPNSTTIRKQMIAFVDSVNKGHAEIAPHPYGDSVDLAGAAARTERAAFAIAAAEQGFSIETDLRYDGRPSSLSELKDDLSGREAHFDEETRTLAISAVGPNQRDRNVGVAVSSAFALACGAIAGGFGYAMSGFVGGALLGSAAAFVALTGSTDSCIDTAFHSRAKGITKEQSLQSFSGEYPDSVERAIRKGEKYQIASEVLPSWIGMNGSTL